MERGPPSVCGRLLSSFSFSPLQTSSSVQIIIDTHITDKTIHPDRDATRAFPKPRRPPQPQTKTNISQTVTQWGRRGGQILFKYMFIKGHTLVERLVLLIYKENVNGSIAPSNLYILFSRLRRPLPHSPATFQRHRPVCSGRPVPGHETPGTSLPVRTERTSSTSVWILFYFFKESLLYAPLFKPQTNFRKKISGKNKCRRTASLKRWELMMRQQMAPKLPSKRRLRLKEKKEKHRKALK